MAMPDAATVAVLSLIPRILTFASWPLLAA